MDFSGQPHGTQELMTAGVFPIWSLFLSALGQLWPPAGRPPMLQGMWLIALQSDSSRLTAFLTPSVCDI